MPFESAEFDKMGWSFVRVVSVSEFSRVKEDDPSCRTPEETSLHAGTEGFQFAYQMLYLLDATGYYSLALHALGIHVCRASGQELMDASSCQDRWTPLQDRWTPLQEFLRYVAVNVRDSVVLNG
ncbi:ubiquitin-protein ligase peroxin 12, variant 3 [Lathyrus oleraceus]|uniref:Ubiquitin-protein ligase peroxin 12, variant 3 n=1 Tax=Pisum sativum TaxID=3888 RepID=A0A9D5AMP7_PEA|nr:ubiquitin-protein ligase peroxin 12, variant 3 [Pisum sativum]